LYVFVIFLHLFSYFLSFYFHTLFSYSYAVILFSGTPIISHNAFIRCTIPQANTRVSKPTCYCLGFHWAAGIVWGLIGRLLGQWCAPYWHLILPPLGQRNWTWILQWHHSMTEHPWKLNMLFYSNVNVLVKLDFALIQSLKKKHFIRCASK